jgi:hypothetical protein
MTFVGQVGVDDLIDLWMEHVKSQLPVIVGD